MFKKIISGCLICTLLSIMLSPLQAVAQTKELTLNEFLKTTDHNQIEAKMIYPSMPRIATNSTSAIRLPANTPIIIRCDETITTNDVVSGSTVRFSVLQDIKAANGTVLIKAGSPVTAQITFAKKRGRLGTSGTVTISDFHTTAVDGTYVPLSGTVSQNPDDKMVLSICLSVLICPLFLLMRGDEARVPAGTTKNSFTVSDVYIKPVNL